MFGVALGLVLAWVLVSRSGGPEAVVQSVSASIAGADATMLLLALLLFTGSQVVRAYRWRVLSLRTTLGLGRALPLTSVHIGLGHLLPVRLSDLALVGLFQHHAALPLGDGTGVVVVAKLLDLVAMGSVVALVVAFGTGGAAAVAAPAVALVGVIGVLLLPWILRWVKGPVGRISTRLSRGHSLLRWYRELRCASSYRNRPGRLLGGLGLSMVVWAMKMVMFLLLLRAVSVDLGALPLWKLFTAFAVTDLTMALPIHGLLGLGTVEAGWTAGFALAGISGAEVVRVGFSVHILWLSMAVAMMALALPLVLFSGGSRGEETAD